ncbi:M13 family peptidase [Sphingorhabdus pulchriflava]|uniref:M13 family peptidase n=1 Tax=Sphingorhabdus pulchriflava TaxID=2292257 RepID=A0A371BIJ1_9SPHN|nr:M13 family metallopeptidase [Sphingorhabdus pulchriflava]RDV07416.1 M13 family peptidase [Sphingorhabdus pulchriflava]
MKISLKSGFCLTAAICTLVISSPLAAQQTTEKAAIGTWGVDTTNMSKTVSAGDDFYRYVNEGWLKTAKAPTGIPYIDAFVEVYLSTEQRVGGIIAEARETTDAPGSPEQMIGDFHRSASDMERRNALGITPIASTLSIVAGTTDRNDIARIMAYPWIDGFMGGGVLANANDPTKQMAAVGVGGLTMPSRDYYLADAEPYIGHRKALLEYIASSLRRAGIDNPDARAEKIMALELEIAKRQWSLGQQRDVVAMNNVMTPAQLKAYAPGFPWDVFLAEMQFDTQSQIKVTTDTATRDIAKLFAETPVADLQSFLTYKTLDAWADSLSEPWVQAHFEFHGKRMQDTSERRPAELEAIASVNAALGEEIGKAYVAEYFGASDRAKVQEMVGYLRDTYRARIQKLEWMDEPTRAEALVKLEKVASYIGYPEKWHDRSNVRITADDYVGNQNRLINWVRADNLKKLTEPTRSWEFPYSPQEINAGYSQSKNSITFPAGVLQPPFFDPKADAAVNFGSIAAVIGHEFGHGFDDQGSRSDGEGKIRDWWTKASRAEFEKRTAGLVDQFNQYDALPGLKINGRQNLGENIGDLGGLSVAYAAYQTYVKEKQGGKAPVIGGFTGDQRFFLAWAQLWRNITSEGETRRRTLSDPHSPGEFRVNGIVRNVDAWYKAFNVKPGDKLYLPPERRVRIW